MKTKPKSKTKKYRYTKFQEEWLKSLETGMVNGQKYRKARGYLCTTSVKGKPVGYCCLGVACEIYNAKVSKSKALKITDEGDGYRYYDGISGALPSVVVNRLKTRGAAANIDVQSHPADLTELNDDTNLSHKQIAKFIRENPEKVFVK